VAANVLDALPIGVMIIGSAGNVISTNRIAQDILVSCDEFAVGKAGVEIEALGQKIRLRDLFSPEIKPKNGKFRDRATNAFSVQRLAGQRPLSVLVSPVSDKLGSKASDEPAAIVYIGDPERILDIDQQRLCQLYGLTRAEARVAALLATGYRLDEAAHHLGLVYETARKHLKHVFGKTGTDRQAELVRLLVTGPAVVRM
jgi:DNA-binding CsgD family transcriptional regulator